MRIRKTTRLVWTFYKGFVLASLLISFSCAAIFMEYGFSVFAEIFWFKALTLGLLYYFMNHYKAKEYYYYFNLGISRAWLWTTILLFDMGFFIFLILMIYRLK